MHRVLRTFNVQEIGYSHLSEGTKPLQDCALSYADEKIAIAAISDGHGSAPYFRSDRGSRFAAQIIIDFLKEFSERNDSLDDNMDEIKKEISLEIQKRWQTQVKNDYEANPISDEELGVFKEEILKNENSDTANRWKKYYMRYKNGEDIFKLYGCTLISVLVTSEYVLGLQVGDGKCVAMYSDGECDQPIPWDDECIANICTSMCDDELRCRISVFNKTPIAIFMASDGIDDTFGDGNGLYTFYRKICYNLIKNGESYIKDLQNTLATISEKGSKDDISISGIYDIEALKPISDILYEYISLEGYNVRASKLRNDINNAMYKLKVCENNLLKAKEDLSGAEAAKGDVQNIIDKLNDELSSVSLQIDEKNALIREMIDALNSED